VPLVFDLVRDASGAFIAAACAITALVIGGALGVVWCCRLTVCIVRRTLETVASLFWSLSPHAHSPRKVAPRGDSPRG
jgi:hypothetical protein